MQWVGILAIGAFVGFLGGMFGKGGSAIATPLLHAIGLPAMVAVAAPLPATLPATLAATHAYRADDLVDGRVVRWSLLVGVPATILGAVATRWIDGGFLVTVTDGIIAVLGLRFLLSRKAHVELAAAADASRTKLVAVAAVVGVVSGLLANSGGFLLAPLYLVVLRLPVKVSFACSLAVAAGLAIPGTVVHAALGHIDWHVVVVFGAASIPLSNLGARVAIRTDAAALERVYGGALALLGGGFLLASL